MDVWRRGTRRATGAELANAAHEATMRKALQNLTNSGGAGALEGGKKRAAAARSEGGSCAEEPAAKRLSQGVAGASSGAGSKRPLIAGACARRVGSVLALRPRRAGGGFRASASAGL
jgi:hypothetical protein